MFASLALVLLLTAAPAQDATPQADAVEPLIIEGYRNGRPMISDLAIEQQLNQLVKDDPGRIVCLRKTPFGTRIGRNYCGTLRQWYDVEAARRMQKVGGVRAVNGGMMGPPPELVGLIRARLRNPEHRAKAEARAKARMEAEAQVSTPVLPPVSHP